MKSPFDRLVREQEETEEFSETTPEAGESSGMEQRKVVDIEFDSKDGKIIWREKYEDGSVSLEVNEEHVDMGNPDAAKERMRQIKSSYGLNLAEDDMAT